MRERERQRETERDRERETERESTNHSMRLTPANDARDKTVMLLPSRRRVSSFSPASEPAGIDVMQLSCKNLLHVCVCVCVCVCGCVCVLRVRKRKRKEKGKLS
jgi:hypothetical protein